MDEAKQSADALVDAVLTELGWAEPLWCWLKRPVKKAVLALVAGVAQLGEEATMKYIRLIGAVICPDPDRHPSVVRYCIWPLLGGPFKDAISPQIEGAIRNWLRKTYPGDLAHPAP